MHRRFGLRWNRFLFFAMSLARTQKKVLVSIANKSGSAANQSGDASPHSKKRD